MFDIGLVEPSYYFRLLLDYRGLDHTEPSPAVDGRLWNAYFVGILPLLQGPGWHPW